MRFADFPFLRYLPFLVTGILLSKFLPTGFEVISLGLLWILYLVGVAKKTPVSLGLSSGFGYLLLLVLGCFLGSPKKEASLPLGAWQGATMYLAEVKQFDIQKPNSSENLLEVFSIRDSLGWKKAQGKVLIYHQLASSLQPGEVVLVNKIPEIISSPSFPDEFDYRGFLAKKDIHYRQFIRSGLVKVDSSNITSPEFAIDRLGKSLSDLIDQKVEFTESKQIANALLLGQKESLDKEIKNAYSETGTMHILAVSGLHVGIIYAILLLPLKRFKSDSKFRKGYLLTVVGLIWLYAVMTGFSPSVVRASTMFSLVTAGQMRKKKPSIWNVLAFSAMLMMVVEPEVIFDVGFQLSYLAVAGIVGLQPLIVRWWLPSNRVLEYFWQLAAVSLAAQLVTFPLSVFYFHQFPTYFLLANLIVVPLAFLIMAVGVPFLFLGWIPILGEVMGWLVNWLIYIQNQITFFIQLLPLGKIDRLTITFSGMVLVWILLLIWGNWEMGNRKKLAVLAMVFFASWGAEGLIREINRPTEQLWFFKKEGKQAIMDLQLGDYHLSWNQSFPSDQLSFSIDPNRLMEKRSAMPEPLRGVLLDSAVWFPGLDLRFFPGKNEITWGSKKPEKIQDFRRDNSGEKIQTDPNLNQNAGFRAIF